MFSFNKKVADVTHLTILSNCWQKIFLGKDLAICHPWTFLYGTVISLRSTRINNERFVPLRRTSHAQFQIYHQKSGYKNQFISTKQRRPFKWYYIQKIMLMIALKNKIKMNLFRVKTLTHLLVNKPSDIFLLVSRFYENCLMQSTDVIPCKKWSNNVNKFQYYLIKII